MVKLIYGIGVNDADYKTRMFKNHNGASIEVWHCKIFRAWRSMIARCYSDNYKSKFPTYKNCSVCDEWLVFSNFKKWASQFHIDGHALDKDLIKEGNKIYCPEFCVFIDPAVNGFIANTGSTATSAYTGCYYDTQLAAFRARCSNPFTKKTESLGLFDCDYDAHLAWKKRKHELACQLAELQTDERVANALRTRYL